MNKFFYAAAAASLIVPTSIKGQEVTSESAGVEISPKHFKFQGVEFYLGWKQNNITEEVKDATFVRIARKTARFVDTKSGIEVPMSCEALSTFKMVAQHTQGPKKFIRELQKGEDAMGCPKGPTV